MNMKLARQSLLVLSAITLSIVSYAIWNRLSLINAIHDPLITHERTEWFRNYRPTRVESMLCSSPLFVAIEADNYDAFKVLLENGESPNTFNRNGFSVLDLTAGKSQCSWIESALAHNADPNLFNEAGGYAAGRPLLSAILSDSEQCIATLLDHGADPNIPVDTSAMTALAVASMQGKWRAVLMVLKGGGDVNAGPPGRTFLDTFKNRDLTYATEYLSPIRSYIEGQNARVPRELGGLQ